MVGQKFSLSRPPRWYHKKTSVPHVVITVGKRSIMAEWSPEDNGRRERVWWMAPMVSVWISSGFRCAWCGSENSDALHLPKTLVVFLHTRWVPEATWNNLARRAQLMCGVYPVTRIVLEPYHWLNNFTPSHFSRTTVKMNFNQNPELKNMFSIHSHSVPCPVLHYLVGKYFHGEESDAYSLSR